jgi:hypothetical protein
VLIIVRDPRDIAASAFRTWKTPVKETIAAWNINSKLIKEFEKKTDPEKYMLIRYEDLVIDTEKLTREILVFLGLAEDDFSWEKLSKLPILGSSDHDGWQVHEHHDSFTPFGKWQSLPNAEKKYLVEADKEYLAYFGYSSSQRKGFLPLPDRDARISIDVEMVCRKPTKNTTTTSFRERLVYAKKGMRLLAKSVF